MKQHLKRKHRQYMDLEKFKKYEQTNNMCFEMAIRNKDIFNVILYINHEHYLYSDKNILQSLEKLYDMLKSRYFDNTLSCIEYIFIHPYGHVCYKLSQILKDVYFIDNITGNEQWLAYYTFSPLYSKDIAFQPNNKNDDYNIQDEIYQDILNGEYDNNLDLNGENIIKLREAYASEFLYDFNVTESSLTYDIKNYDGYCVENYFDDFEYIPTNFFDNDYSKSSKHKITPNFARPYLLTTFTNKFVTLENINLALPEEELFDYILHLKKHYNKENDNNKQNFLVTCHNLYFDKLYKLQKKITINKSRGKPLHLNYLNTLDIKSKFADMFYIYDAKQLGMANSDIIEELNYHHNVKKDNTLVNKYYSFATALIEQCHYKRMLTHYTQINFNPNL
jgi:hypothetical protein